MGRPPSNGGPSFRFNPVEVGEMEAILQAHNYTVPSREILEALAQRFSTSADRAGKVEVSGKQVWNWFQNRRYALRAKAARTSVPGQVNMPSVPRDDQSVVRNVPQAPQPQVSQPPPAPQNMVRSMPQVPQPLPMPSAQNASWNVSDNSLMEFEAKSARDGAWYDVASFLSHRSLESGDPEAMVRFAGFGPEEDEWVNIRRHIRQRSLPCESSECVAVLPGDLILCFQEGKEQALYFDAHVLDAQRRRHDVRGCRCRFLVRYDHDQSEEIVPLRKICRRPETDHRLQQLHAMPLNVNPQKIVIEAQAGNILRFDAADSTIQKQQPKQEQRVNSSPMTTSATPTTIPPAGESKLVPSKAVDAGNATAVANTDSSNTATVNESKLVPSKLADARNATAVANIDSSSTATVNESKLVPSKAVDAGNATSVANTDSSSTATVNASKLVPSKVFDAGNATAVANTDSSSTATVNESKLVPSKAADAADATGVANADSSDTAAVNESKLVPSKVADAGNITAIANADSSNTAAVDESKLLPSKAADAGNATAVSNTDSSNTAAVNESNLVPSKAADAGNATAVANTDSSDTAAVNGSNLVPSKAADAENATAVSNTDSPNTAAVNESNIVPSKAADVENATAVANTDSSNTAAVNEPNIVPSKAADVENATAVANTDSSNTAALNTAATGVSHPTLPQG